MRVVQKALYRNRKTELVLLSQHNLTSLCWIWSMLHIWLKKGVKWLKQRGWTWLNASTRVIHFCQYCARTYCTAISSCTFFKRNQNNKVEKRKEILKFITLEEEDQMGNGVIEKKACVLYRGKFGNKSTLHLLSATRSTFYGKSSPVEAHSFFKSKNSTVFSLWVDSSSVYLYF